MPGLGLVFMDMKPGQQDEITRMCVDIVGFEECDEEIEPANP